MVLLLVLKAHFLTQACKSAVPFLQKLLIIEIQLNVFDTFKLSWYLVFQILIHYYSVALSDPNLLSKSTSKCEHCETRFTFNKQQFLEIL